MANQDKNADREHMQQNKPDGQRQHDESNMELGEHQSGHMMGQQQGQQGNMQQEHQSGKSGATATQTGTAGQHPMEGQQPAQQGEYQQASKMSTDEPAEGSRKNVDDDLKRPQK